MSAKISYYYLGDGGETLGPVDRSELGALRDTGQITDKTPVSGDGWKEWIPAAAVLDSAEHGTPPKQETDKFYVVCGGCGVAGKPGLIARGSSNITSMLFCFSAGAFVLMSIAGADRDFAWSGLFFLGWLLFGLLWLFYLVWRASTKRICCRTCKSLDVVSIHLPRGKKLLRDMTEAGREWK